LLRSKRGDFVKSARTRIKKYYIKRDTVDEESLEGKTNLAKDVEKICDKIIKTRRVTQNDQDTVKRLILVHFKKLPPQEDDESDSD
jgi:hypothetical protein